jgi:NAD(P)-dependent dehydrogenase (short-subunit alcohol dehydrogenase family)
MVLVGSVAGAHGRLVASAHYVASKGGLHALVKWLARRGAPFGVLVNGIAPGEIDTAVTHGEPIGPAHITGTVLDVNGGLYMN